jgi:SAM-dependent methyltransferase
VNGVELAVIGRELLDDPAADPAAVRESLHNIARSNRWFGGRQAVRHGLARLCRGLPSGTSLTMLDVGTGLGDLPADAVRWGVRRGIRLVPFGLERSRPAAELARDAGLPMVLGCAGSLPIRRGSVDIVVLSQVAHHMHGDAVIRMARELTLVARIGVVLADLRRSRLAMLGFWMGSRLLRFDQATRADGLTSVRRSYTRMELKTLLSRADINATVEERPGFRLVATWRSR